MCAAHGPPCGPFKMHLSSPGIIAERPKYGYEPACRSEVMSAPSLGRTKQWMRLSRLQGACARVRSRGRKNPRVKSKNSDSLLPAAQLPAGNVAWVGGRREREPLARGPLQPWQEGQEPTASPDSSSHDASHDALSADDPAAALWTAGCGQSRTARSMRSPVVARSRFRDLFQFVSRASTWEQKS